MKAIVTSRFIDRFSDMQVEVGTILSDTHQRIAELEAHGVVKVLEERKATAPIEATPEAEAEKPKAKKKGGKDAR